jgi:hypothetical protein
MLYDILQTVTGCKEVDKYLLSKALSIKKPPGTVVD